MNQEIAKFEEAATVKPPESYYDIGEKEYPIKDVHGNWINMTEAQFKRVLTQHGISHKKDKDSELSPQDEVLLHLQQERNVMWSGSLAGHKVGLYEMSGTRILVKTSPNIIEPVDGNCTMLRSIIEGVLADRNGEQVPYFLAWLKLSYEALRAGKCQPGQAIVFCGPHGCGKSLLQHVITAVLGGRAAKPYQAMSGGTAFNADIFSAEHLMLEDEQPSTDIRARRAFGSQIKAVTVNVEHRLHAKHRDALVLKPFWRLSVSLNDEPENVMVLPPIDDSLEDKMMIFKAVRYTMPMPTATATDRSAFWEEIVRQVPAMLAYLLKMDIPAKLRSERFGVKHYHHPEILAILDSLAPETRLLSLLDMNSGLFLPGKLPLNNEVPMTGYFEGTAEEIERRLTAQGSGVELEARRLFSWNVACGTYLGRLAKQYPDRVQEKRSDKKRMWRIIWPSEGAQPESTPHARQHDRLEVTANDTMTASFA